MSFTTSEGAVRSFARCDVNNAMFVDGIFPGLRFLP